MPMKIIQVNYSDAEGGAARAAYRQHHALRSCGIDSVMFVNDARTGDATVCGPGSDFGKLSAYLRAKASRLPSRVTIPKGRVLRSCAILPSPWLNRINDSDADLVNLHWVAAEMLSIADIGRLRKPLVWTLHDMWAFCGAEHVFETSRWQDGYLRENRPPEVTGFDLDRWVWQRKCACWKKPFQIVTPSSWLARCVGASRLMSEWPVEVIPNAIDTAQWAPFDKAMARKLLHLPPEVHLLLFGAFGGGDAPVYKGFDLLLQALRFLQDSRHELEVVILGQLSPNRPHQTGLRTHYMGQLYDDVSLRLLYSAADVMVIPSRRDNLPNMGKESLCCGTPVVAFDTCGLPDIVEHQRTGYLAKAFDPEDLARGILWVLGDRERYRQLQTSSRAKAVGTFDYPIIGKQYARLYGNILSDR